MDFARKVFQVLLSKYIALFLEVFNSIIIVRSLGVFDYGRFTILYLLPMVIVSFVSLGLGPSIIYFINQGRYSLKSFFWTFLVFGLVLGGISYLFVLFFGDYLLFSYFFNTNFDKQYIYIALLFIPIVLIQKYLRAILRGLYKTLEFTLIVDFMPSFLRLLFLGGMFFFYHLSFDTIFYLPIIVQGSITVMVACTLLYYIDFSDNSFVFLPLKSFFEIVRFGLKSFFGGVIQKANDQVIQFISVPLLSIEAMGLFSLGLKLISMFTSCTSSLQTVVVPKFSQSGVNDIRLFIPKLFRLVAFVVVILGFVTFVSIPFIVEWLYTSEFLPSVSIFCILLPGYGLLVFVRLINSSFTQSGYPFVKSYIRLFGFLTNIFLLSFLIKWFDVHGLALSISLSYVSMFILALFLLIRKHKFSLVDLFLVTRSDILEMLSIAKMLFSSLRRKTG